MGRTKTVLVVNKPRLGRLLQQWKTQKRPSIEGKELSSCGEGLVGAREGGHRGKLQGFEGRWALTYKKGEHSGGPSHRGIDGNVEGKPRGAEKSLGTGLCNSMRKGESRP